MFICEVCGNTNAEEKAKKYKSLCNKCKNARVRAKRAANPNYKAEQKVYRAELYKKKKESDPEFAATLRRRGRESYWRKKERLTTEEASKAKEKHSAYCKQWYENRKANDPNYLRHRKNRHYESYHGISITDYEDKLSEQEGKCAICGAEEKLLVDHNHKTGFIRGLLCGYCNFGIGNFRDNRDFLAGAIGYLTFYEKEENAAAGNK